MKTRTLKFGQVLKRFFVYLKSIDPIWLTIWGVIFFSFITLDLTYQTIYGDQSIFATVLFAGHEIKIPIVDHGTFIGVTILKILGICLAYVYAFKKFKKDYLLHIALGFTFLADILLLLDNTSPSGILVFCMAQYFHTARFTGAKPKNLILWTFFIVVMLFYGNFIQVPPIITLAVVYATSMFMNIIQAYKWSRSSRKEPTDNIKIVASHCALWGFILFFLCDINVCISFFARIETLPFALFGPANFFAWLFYYPSQVLISNSSVKVAHKTNNMI